MNLICELKDFFIIFFYTINLYSTGGAAIILTIFYKNIMNFIFMC